jgi:ketosteroid isomerase-like protein
VLEGVFFRLATEWTDFSVPAGEITGLGDTALAPGRYRGTSEATGCHVDAQFAHVWTLSAGKVARFQQYTDTSQFRAAITAPRSAGA